MGMMGQVQFINYCGSGDLGVPKDTKAMGEGLAWANVQFDPPWGTAFANRTNSSTSSNGTTRRAARVSRRLLDDSEEEDEEEDDDAAGKAAEAAAAGEGCAGTKSECAATQFQGTLFYNTGFIIMVCVMHWLLVAAIEIGTGVGADALPGSIQFPGWEIASAMAVWTPLALSATMAFATHMADYTSWGDQSDTFNAVIAGCIITFLLIQIPFLVWQIRTLTAALYGDHPSVEYRYVPLGKRLAARPTCKWGEVSSCGECFQLLVDWADFIICLPFRMDFQGAWTEKPGPKIPHFVEIYAPLFKKYSAASEWGYLYGVFELVHKVLMIWLIGSSVKASADDDPSHPSDQRPALWCLCALHIAQALFLITQFPFNERFENIVQFFTSGCQGMFFLALAITPAWAEEERGKPDGGMLTQINLAGMAVVMIASIKAQVSGMQKKVMKMKKNFYLCLSKTKAFVKDPVHFLCGETHFDSFPLNAELFFRPYLKVPPHVCTTFHKPVCPDVGYEDGWAVGGRAATPYASRRSHGRSLRRCGRSSELRRRR
jgi:hypothetical protein